MREYRVPYDEQESWIHVDYQNRKVNIYSTRPSCVRKLNKVYDGKDNNEWTFSFDDRNDIKKSLSLAILLPRKKNEKVVNNLYILKTLLVGLVNH